MKIRMLSTGSNTFLNFKYVDLPVVFHLGRLPSIGGWPAIRG